MSLVLALAALAVTGCGGSSKPNVVLIVLDTTRADFLSSYGFPGPTTPSIDALGEEGVRYTRAFSTCYWTLPSHATLFTGLYPRQAGATSETNRLPHELATLAELLGAGGYRTAAATLNPWITAERGFRQGFEKFKENWRVAATEGAQPPIAETAVAWIDELAGKDQPFFLFLNLNSPHLPYDPPAEIHARFIAGERDPERLEHLTNLEGPLAHFVGELELSSDDFEMLRELYAAEVAVADGQVGRVVAALRDHDVLDDTLVIVTSDHGENIGDHGMIDHVFSMFDTTLRVPLVVRFPDRFTPGTVVDELVSLVDVFPTIQDVCGLVDDGIRAEVETRSLCGARRRSRSFIVAENERPVNAIEVLRSRFPAVDAESLDHPLRVIRTERHKLIWDGGDGIRLYDLQDDPDESDSLAGRFPDLEAELLGRLREWDATISPAGSFEDAVIDDPEAQEQLRALGYVE